MGLLHEGQSSPPARAEMRQATIVGNLASVVSKEKSPAPEAPRPPPHPPPEFPKVKSARGTETRPHFGKT